MTWRHGRWKSRYKQDSESVSGFEFRDEQFGFLETQNAKLETILDLLEESFARGDALQAGVFDQ